MLKNVLSVVFGYAAWTMIFLGGASLIRMIWSSAHDDQGITSDIKLLVGYLILSIVASLMAGLTTVSIAGSAKMKCVSVLAICLLATGIPVQLSTWDVLPVWYNLIFLILLVPVTIAGAKIVAPRRS